MAIRGTSASWAQLGWLRFLTAGALAALLAACGGGGDAQDVSAPTRIQQQALLSMRLLQASAQTVSSTRATVTPTEFMNWAERTYPQIFPSAQTSIGLSSFLVRFYPQTGTYLGIDGETVYLLGPVTGGALLPLGRISDFACAVDAQACGSSPLAGRGWTSGVKLNTNTAYNGTNTWGGIDDAGRVTLVFTKSNGTRLTVYATQGTPNGPGVAPTFGTPLAIDNQTFTSAYTDPIRLAVAPNGNAVATWFGDIQCTANTYRTTGNTCRAMFSARYLVSTGAWEAPVMVGDTPSGYPTSFTGLSINNRGDISMPFFGWVKNPNNSISSLYGVAWKKFDQPKFTTQTLGGTDFGQLDFGMSATGAIMLAGEAKQNATTDLVVYRGSVDSGLGGQEILDSRGAAASLITTAVGTQGQIIVVWHQNDGTKNARWAAVAGSSTGTFQVDNLGSAAGQSAQVFSFVTDKGEVILHDTYNLVSRRWAQTVWSSGDTMPSGVNFTFATQTFNRNGDMLGAKLTSSGSTCTTGVWATYDAFTNKMVSAFSTAAQPANFIIGIDTCNKGANYLFPLLSAGGFGAVVMNNSYDVLPTPALPNGDSRNIDNYWVAYLK